MKADRTKTLLDEFPAHTYGQWKEAAEQLLKGRSFEKTLITPTYEGFELEPIYTREVLDGISHAGDLPGQGSQVRGQRVSGYLEAGWRISQEIAGPTAAEANRIAMEQAVKGQDELNFRLDEASRTGVDADVARPGQVGVCGVSIGTKEDMKTLLAGIDLEKVSLYLQGRQAAPSMYALLVAALKEMGADAGKVRGCLGMDPAGSLAETGTATSEFEDVLDMVGALLVHAQKELPGMQILDVQGHAYHNGGASSAQELAAVLAAAVLYLRAMDERGIALGKVVPRMRLSVSIGGNYFIEIAKLRALRLLWSRIMEAFEVPGEHRAVHIHARTGIWNKTLFDPYVNMLRTTTEAFSAVVGGCDSLHVGPFDEAIRESSPFSRRIAFNMHAILAEECDMRRVVDPAGGSWAVESLTDQMAQSAWKIFQRIESEGGIIGMLQAGKFQQEVEAVRQMKLQNIQRRRDVIIGTNAYPNAAEKVLPAADIDHSAVHRQLAERISAFKNKRDNASLFNILDNPVAAAGGERMEAMISAAEKCATVHELQSSAGLGTLLDKAAPIRLVRAAEEFEQLRLAAMELGRAGRPPVIHQLNIGPSRRYRIRADWTSAFFQAGGFTVINEDDYDSSAAALQALGESGAKIAVITSDDETYPGIVGELAGSIRDSRPDVTVYVAGAPGDNEAAWKAAGVDGYVNIRVNTYQLNRELLESLGASL